MRHPLTAMVAVVVLVLGVSGCNGDPTPPVADPTTDPPTSTATTEPVVDPPTSTPTDEPKPESVEAFIRRWQAAVVTMQVTGKTSAYRMFGPNCGPCSKTADLVDMYYAAGGFIELDDITVTRIKKLGKIDDHFEFEVDRTTAPTRYKEAASGPIKTFPGGDDRIRVNVARSHKSWTVLDVVQVAT